MSIATLAPTAPWKITPSMLTFLWDECPRCFWLHSRGHARPSAPFPRIFNQIHDLLFRQFQDGCPSKIAPALPAGRMVCGERWVQSRPLRLEGTAHRVWINGRLDHLAQFDDGTWGVIDYKTAAPKADLLVKYSRQLHAYAWALERAGENGFAATPVRRLGLLCLDPEALAGYDHDRRVLLALRPTWIEVRRDDAAFARFLAEVVRLLAQPRPPVAARDCAWCKAYDKWWSLTRPSL
jgi:hypothetical protein